MDAAALAAELARPARARPENKALPAETASLMQRALGAVPGVGRDAIATVGA